MEETNFEYTESETIDTLASMIKDHLAISTERGEPFTISFVEELARRILHYCESEENWRTAE